MLFNATFLIKKCKSNLYALVIVINNYIYILDAPLQLQLGC